MLACGNHFRMHVDRTFLGRFFKAGKNLFGSGIVWIADIDQNGSVTVLDFDLARVHRQKAHVKAVDIDVVPECLSSP